MNAPDLSRLTRANIYLRDELAGHLEKIEGNNFRFTYSNYWLSQKDYSIGLAFPRTIEPYVSVGELFPFFDNLIPEGWLLNIVLDQFKIVKENRFGLLLQTGQETIGAIKVIAINDFGKEVLYPKASLDDRSRFEFIDLIFKVSDYYCSYCLQDLTEAQKKKNNGYHDKCSKDLWGTAKKLKIGLDVENPWKSFQDTVRGASVEGYQRKGLFLLDKNDLLPSAFNSHYIVKPQGAHLESLPENEHVTMAIAKACGFKVPPFGIFSHSKLGNVYVIKRFDITPNGDHLRMEDGGQFLSFSSEDKYDGSYHELAEAIKRYSSVGISDVIDMWRRIIFCFLTANSDMHLKNWSLLELEEMRGIFRLAPCYDLLNTRVPIPDENEEIALNLYDGKRKLSRKYFYSFANELGIKKYADQVFSKDIHFWKEVIEKLIPRSRLSQIQKESYLKIVNERYKLLTEINS